MRTMWDLFLMLPCLMAILVGYGPGAVREDVSESTANEKDRSVEAEMKLVADWQSHIDFFYSKGIGY